MKEFFIAVSSVAKLQDVESSESIGEANNGDGSESEKTADIREEEGTGGGLFDLYALLVLLLSTLSVRPVAV